MNSILTFDRQYRFLSNFYPCWITYGSIRFPTSEHAFQACKTLDLTVAAYIAQMSGPGAAKRYAKKYVALRPDWEEVKEGFMLDVLRLKFADGRLRTMLLETGDAWLEEGNTWGDCYWGVCGGVGANRLGHLLMQVRHEVRA